MGVGYFAAILWAQSASGGELVFEGLAVGDVDCSGAKDQVVLSRTADGDLVVEVALDVPEELLSEPVSSEKGAQIDILDLDGDLCGEIFLTEVETYTLPGGDKTWLLGASGGKDDAPDVHAVMRTFKGGLSLGFGFGGFSDVTDCAPTCVQWEYVVYPCASRDDGHIEFCGGWVCVRTEESCLPA